MNVLFVTGHPAQIHNFRNVRNLLMQHGHKVYWLTTKKDITTNLLDKYAIPYELLRKPNKSIFNRIGLMLGNTFHVIQTLCKYHVDIVVTRMDPYTAVAAKLMRIPNIMVQDTEHAVLSKFGKIFAPLGFMMVSPACFWLKPTRSKQLSFSANIELFYTHPKEFTPMAPWELLGIEPQTPYALVRFVKWDAYHDTKLVGGFSIAQKEELIRRLAAHVRVFISSETELPASLEPYRIQIPIERMHDVQAYASLFIGESATMASESVCLGTPAIYVDEIGRGYTDEEARAGLLWMYRPYNDVQCTPHDASQYDVTTAWQPADPHRDAQGREPWWIGGGIPEAIAQAEYIVSPDFDRAAWTQRHAQWMQTKIDPTAWLTWFIENYPASVNDVKKADTTFWQRFM